MNKQLLVKNLLVSYLYISFSTPISFLLIGLPMVLYMEGFNPSAIGWFQLASIPYIIVFLFAPIFDGIVFKENHYKKWLGIFAIVYLVLLSLMTQFSLKEDYYILFTLIFLSVFTSTFLDTPLNALSVKIYTKEEQTSAGSFKSFAYFTSSILGNGLILFLYNTFGWNMAILSIIGIIIPSFIILFFIKEQKSEIVKRTVDFKQIINFFKQKNIFSWLIVLISYFTFIFPLWIYLKPYFLSHGFSANQVALYAGLIGSTIAALSSLSVSFFVKRMQKKQLLFSFALLNTFTLALFLTLELLSTPLMIVNTIFIALSMGLSNSVFFAMIMHHCRKEYKAIDYSIQLSMDALGRILMGILAGFIIETFSFKSLFLICFIGIFIVLFFIYRYVKNPLENT